MLGLSELLLRDRPLDDVLAVILAAVISLDGILGAAILLPVGGRLEVRAADGATFSDAELDAVTRGSSSPVPVSLQTRDTDGVGFVALTAGQRPIGLLALRGAPVEPGEMPILLAFASHAALAIERTSLRAEAARAELLARTDEMRQALLATVAHDVRNPLATVKAATSCLRDASLSIGDRDDLHELVESQIDYLSRLVSGLLDAARCQAGVLAVHGAPHPIRGLVEDAVSQCASRWDPCRVCIDVPDDLPEAHVDPLLIRQVLVNLLDNAHRYAPSGTVITVSARHVEERVEVAVADQGPGISPEGSMTVFEPFCTGQTGGRSGLGLAIAKAFVGAHGEDIRVDRGTSSGARLVFGLPVRP